MDRATRDKLTFLNMVKKTESDCTSWLAEMCDLFLDLSYPQKRAILSYFVELDIGDKNWESSYNDESRWMDLWGNILYYFTGRDEIKKEPDQKQFIELIKDFFATDKYKDAKEDSTREETGESFTELLEEL